MIANLLPTRRLLGAAPCARSWGAVRLSSSRSGSSSIWLTRQRADPYVRARSMGPEGESHASDSSFVARSAFKLLELQKSSNGALIRPGMRIVDLGAAPGGWVQAALLELEKGSSKSKPGGGGVVVAVDLLPLHASLAASPAVVAIQGNFLDPIVQSKILSALEPFSPGMSGPRVDLVLSDMLQNLTGNVVKDAQGSMDLCAAALEFALGNLAVQKDTMSTKETDGERGPRGRTRAEKKGPVLVMKSLTSDLSKDFERELKRHFATVRWEKPTSSRPESREGYWVCAGLREQTRKLSPDEIEQQEDEELAIYF